MVIIIYEVPTNFSRFSFLIFLFRNFYLCTALPRRFFYNFGSLSLQIVKLAFHWRWIFAFVAGRTCCCDPDLSRFRSSSYQGVIAQNHVFFSFSGQAIAREMLSRKGLHCVFQEYIFIVATPEITGNQVKSSNVRVVEG